MNPRKLVIFDMDGTVLDSMSFLRTMGINLISYAYRCPKGHAADHYDSTVGRPFEHQVRTFKSEFNADPSYSSRLAKLYHDLHFTAAPMFNLTELGKQLSAFRHDLYPQTQFALVSSTHREIVEQCVATKHIVFHRLDGFDGQRRTKSIQIMEAIQRLRFKGSNVAYVGDTNHDQRIAASLDIAYFNFDWRDPIDIRAMLDSGVLL